MRLKPSRSPDTDYSLAACILSSDLERVKRVAGQIEAGRVAINAVPREPHAPFGGFKQSGIGREFGAFGLDAFPEPRTIIA
ncbi:aldehyde dehydrogenase family protein [Sphingobium sp. EM0848]|uniref:aldehyde dehydrogenase family protein n=1 Tax=Sphingobium sp. EM0848 TaxID=2743473 RepID=UPI0021009A49|nr:aldehyde dehydrogenase family protein [Sphingobium sp. EM0848]